MRRGGGGRSVGVAKGLKKGLKKGLRGNGLREEELLREELIRNGVNIPLSRFYLMLILIFGSDVLILTS